MESSPPAKHEAHRPARVRLFRRSILLNALASTASLALVFALAIADQKREARSSLDDFAQEQHRLARSAAIVLRNRLDVLRRDAYLAADEERVGRTLPPSILSSYTRISTDRTPAQPDQADTSVRLVLDVAPERAVEVSLSAAELLRGMEVVEADGESAVLLRPPRRAEFLSIAGKSFGVRELLDAAEKDAPSVELSGDQATRFGLPKRTAYAGLASFDAGALGTWSIAVVASAERLRDRQARTRMRLGLSILIAAALVGTFATLLLLTQRREHTLARDLESAAINLERGERLERAMKVAAMGTLATGIAHEVSTPLGVITGRAERLLDMPLDERVERSVRAILEQAARINQVVRSFLDVARGSGPSVSRQSPARIVQDAIELVEHRFVQEGVSLTTEIAPDVPAISCDARLFVHTLVNLLLNARDACKVGDAVLARVYAEGATVIFEVVDNGVGIDEQTALRVTEPFVTTKSAGAGTGLGLAITKEIVSMHRGKLQLSPGPAGGTVARISVPRAEQVE